MSSIITNEFRVQNAQNFINDVKSYTHYIGIGKIDDWDNKSREPQPTRQTQIYSWDSMIGGKQILDNRISLVIPRIDWTLGTIYTMYDDSDSELDTSSFYVVTDEANVYKCLYNNNGQPSTVKPTETNTTNMSLSDGYIWKYMYSISIEEANNFMTNNFMPVKTLMEDDGSLQWTVQKTSIKGSIDVIKVVEGGLGYSVVPTVIIKGDGQGAEAIASLDEDGTVSKIQITNSGSNYTYAEVIIEGGNPTNPAIARAILSPEGGHGSDPANELFGRYVMLGATLSGDEEQKLPITNDFRIITIIRNPTITGDPEFTEDFVIPVIFNELTKLSLSEGYTGEFNLDDVVTGMSSGATGKVADFDEINGVISLCNVHGVFQPNESIESTSNGMSVIGTITEPDLIKGSGQIIYVDYRNPISRAEDQEENIRITLEF